MTNMNGRTMTRSSAMTQIAAAMEGRSVFESCTCRGRMRTARMNAEIKAIIYSRAIAIEVPINSTMMAIER